MGVLYEARDDIADILSSFVTTSGSSATLADVTSAYHGCTLGHLTPPEFWAAVGLAQAVVEERYLSLYRPFPGAHAFLKAAAARGRQVACLSNDTVEGSVALRKRHGLTDLVNPWVISAAVGARKPDRVIYEALAATAGADFSECVFVDDRTVNLETAESLGMATVLFGDSGKSWHHRVADFGALGALLGVSGDTGRARA